MGQLEIDFVLDRLEEISAIHKGWDERYPERSMLKQVYSSLCTDLLPMKYISRVTSLVIDR